MSSERLVCGGSVAWASGVDAMTHFVKVSRNAFGPAAAGTHGGGALGAGDAATIESGWPTGLPAGSAESARLGN
jgi:hypothetical protein